MKYTPKPGDYFFAEGPRGGYYGKCTEVEGNKAWAAYSRASGKEDRPALAHAGGVFYTDEYEFTKLPSPHNPDGVASPGEGYRFLDADEVHKVRKPLLEIERWSRLSQWWRPGSLGNMPSKTYRTKLSRTELRALQNLQPMKPNLRNFHASFENADLALLAAYWLRDQGYTWDTNIIAIAPGIASLSTPAQGLITWQGQQKQVDHFDSLQAFQTWFNRPPVLIPNFGEYAVSVTATGVKVGCTEVTFEVFDDILAAVAKARAVQ